MVKILLRTCPTHMSQSMSATFQWLKWQMTCDSPSDKNTLFSLTKAVQARLVTSQLRQKGFPSVPYEIWDYDDDANVDYGTLGIDRSEMLGTI
jgi:hypothetical protein